MTNKIDDPNNSQDTTEIIEVQTPTPQEIANILRGHQIGQILGKRILKAIEECDDAQESLGLAYTAIFDKGEDPDSIMQELGLIKPEQTGSTPPDLDIIEILKEAANRIRTELAGRARELEKDPNLSPSLMIPSQALSHATSQIETFLDGLRETNGQENPTSEQIRSAIDLALADILPFNEAQFEDFSKGKNLKNPTFVIAYEIRQRMLAEIPDQPND